MALEHIQTNGTENGLTASNKINLGFTQCDQNAADIVILSDAILANQTQITTNIDNIDDNSAAIVALQEAKNTLDYQKRGSVSNISETYTRLCDMVTPTREAGIYMVGISGTYTFDQTNKSAYIRFSIDAGSSWFEFRREPKDNTDSNAVNYFFPLNFNGGNFHIIVEARKEDSNGTLDFQFIDVTFDSKRNANEIPYP